MNAFRLFSALVTVAVALSAMAAFTTVDLRPRVEDDFFFSTDDPELQASQEIGRLFPSAGQLLISATAEDITDDAYLERIRALSTELQELPGVASVQSLTHGPTSARGIADSPLWSRLLLGESPNLSQILIFLEDRDPSSTTPEGSELIAGIEPILERHHRASFALGMSGVPYVIELVRRSLEKDLRTFSTAALIVFGLLIALIYRSWRIVVGTLCTCLGACVTTLVILSLLGSSIGLLTANIITIVFVLTLSHIVFITAHWRTLTRRAEVEGGSAEVKALAVRRTFSASIWCMATTLLGFASLLTASAKPLRELGLAGAVGTTVALIVAFGLYPLFLKPSAGRPQGEKAKSGGSLGRILLPLGSKALPAFGLAAVLLAPGLGSLDTDPNLLSYFDPDSELRRGLERIDRNGGSSPLLLVVSEPDGGRLDTHEAQQRMSALHQAIEESPEVGSAVSLPILLAEAKRVPMAFLLGWSQLIDILESAAFDHVATGFVTPERTQGLYFLRMRESERGAPRSQVVQQLTDKVAENGLRADLVGGLYPLQAQLGELITGSLVRGLGGLLALFAIITFFVARSARASSAMIAGLIIVPVTLLGGMGYLGAPIDVISSPAANVAIALGIDSMIHLVAGVRRRRSSGASTSLAWQNTLDELGGPILAAAAILAGGFGIFVLSSFPPTARFGLSVAAGTLIAASVALLVVPWLAGGRPKEA